MPGDQGRGAGRISLILIPLIYLILPNLPIWLFERKMALYPHGYINVECLLVGVLAVFLPRVLTFFLLIFEVCAAFVYLVCYTYQFSLSNLLASTHYLSLLPAGRRSVIFLVLLTIALLSAVAAFAIPRPEGPCRKFVAAILSLGACLFICLDTVDGQNPALPRDAARSMRRITISPLAELAKRSLFFRAVEASADKSKDTAMASASAAGIRFLEQRTSTKSPNVVLVLVESWGLFRDQRLADAITAGYQQPTIAEKYNVSFGTAPFPGLTVPGEARELCHSRVGFGIMNLTTAQEGDCLPAIFHSRGYQDIAVHGYIGEMFSRERWYKTIGFDQRWFGPDLEQLGLSRCDGAFPGVCDGDIADWIGRSLLSQTADQPRFVYWVTLNSHLPVSEPTFLPPDNVCASYSELKDSRPLCSWFRLISQVHRSVQRLALEGRDRSTVFILVGDHAPPFSNPHLRQLFSDSNVPYVILTPRDPGSFIAPIQHGGS